MLELMPASAVWPPAANRRRCAVATTDEATGAVPRPVGTSMPVSKSGDILGRFSQAGRTPQCHTQPAGAQEHREFPWT